MRHLTPTVLLTGAAALALALPAGAQERPSDDAWWTPVLAEVVRDRIPERARGADDRARGAEDRARDRGERAEEARERAERARERAEEAREEARERAEEARERARRGGRPDVRGGPAARERAGNGPPFCRSGAGHPVHGWEWCVRKGWARGGALGRVGPLGDVRWERASWEDVVFGRDAPRRETRMDERGLLDVLGSVILGRIGAEERAAPGTGRLEGRWVPQPGGGAVLQVRAGGTPLAELADVDGDRRVDAVLLREAPPRR